MSSPNCETEAQLDALTDICCESLRGEAAIDEERVEQIVRALLKSGFEHQDGGPLATQLEERVRQRCKEPAIHRGGEIQAIANAIQHKYNDARRWLSTQPSSGHATPAKAANVSSATNA